MSRVVGSRAPEGGEPTKPLSGQGPGERSGRASACLVYDERVLPLAVCGGRQSLPGGGTQMVDPAAEAAVREAWEEVGTSAVVGGEPSAITSLDGGEVSLIFPARPIGQGAGPEDSDTCWVYLTRLRGCDDFQLAPALLGTRERGWR